MLRLAPLSRVWTDAATATEELLEMFIEHERKSEAEAIRLRPRDVYDIQAGCCRSSYTVFGHEKSSNTVC